MTPEDAPRVANNVCHQPPSAGLGYGHTSSSLLLIFPLWIVYEFGLLFSPSNNGVDFLSELIFAAVDRDQQNYVFVHLALGGVFLFLLIALWRRGKLAMEQLTPMLLESVIYALTLGSFIIFLMDRLMGLEVLALGRAQLGNALVISLGAGVHEELVFRLLGMGGGGMLLCTLLKSRTLAIVCAAIVSAVLFALAHHVGATGEALHLPVVTYRIIAGLSFSAIFYFRSLAHAVYTHFLYDLYVLVITQ